MMVLVGLLLTAGCVADSAEEDEAAPPAEGLDVDDEVTLGAEPAREATLRGDLVTLTLSGPEAQVRIELPIEAARSILGTYGMSEGGGDGPSGALTEIGPPARTFEAVSGDVAITGCSPAVGERITGRWESLRFEEAATGEARHLEGDFEPTIVEVADFQGLCTAPSAPVDDPPQACAERADTLCPTSDASPCCAFRGRVEACHAQCDLGACANPQFSGCLLCRQACVQNIVDVGCEDRYTTLGRCQFDGGCVGDQELSCTLQRCCGELVAALSAD